MIPEQTIRGMYMPRLSPQRRAMRLVFRPALIGGGPALIIGGGGVWSHRQK